MYLTVKGDYDTTTRSVDRTTVIGVMLAFLGRCPSQSGSVWSDGRRLESHRVVLGKWAPGSVNPSVRTIPPSELRGSGAPRTVVKHHRWYKELVTYHINNFN
jgi:hypothetical protein